MDEGGGDRNRRSKQSEEGGLPHVLKAEWRAAFY
jgi:hypothetical protein